MNNDGEPFVCGDCFHPFGAHAFDCPRLPAEGFCTCDGDPRINVTCGIARHREEARRVL